LSFLFTKSFEHSLGAQGDLGYKHEVERNYAVIASRFKRFVKQPKLYPSANQYEKVKQFQTQKYLTISPASVWFTKQWPQENWVALINKKSAIKIYLLGAPSDKDYLLKIQSSSAGNTAEMNYVNDSAPLHLASSMNAPVTAVFCSTIPEFGFGPLSDKSHVWQESKNLECRPCGIHGFKSCPKGHFKCAKVSL